MSSKATRLILTRTHKNTRISIAEITPLGTQSSASGRSSHLHVGMWHVIACFLLSICMTASESAGARADSGLAKHILIIGNSITYTNNLPAALYALIVANRPGEDVAIDMYVKGGAQLSELAGDHSVYDVMKTGVYDTVIIQERGGNASCAATADTREKSQCVAVTTAHRRIAAFARRHSSRVYYLGTYQGSASTNKQLEEGERWLSKEMAVAYIDIAYPWQILWTSLPDYQWLYSKTNIHPGPALTSLMAIEIYRAIYNEYPAGGALCTTADLFSPSTHFDGLVLFGTLNASGSNSSCLVSAEQVQTILDTLKSERI